MNEQRKRLIRLFTFEKPFALKYRRRSQEHQDDLLELGRMMKDGIVKIVEKDSKYITYFFVGQLG